MVTVIKKRMRKLFMRFLVRIVRRARNKSLREALAKANKITGDTGKTCLIYFICGQYEVYTKQDVKKVKHLGHFKELSMQQLLRKAELMTMKYGKQRPIPPKTQIIREGWNWTKFFNRLKFA